MGYKQKGFSKHRTTSHLTSDEGRWSRFKNWVSDKMPQTDQFPRGSAELTEEESIKAYHDNKKKAYEKAKERDAQRKAQFDKHEKFLQTKDDYEPRDYESHVKDNYSFGGTDLDIIKRYEDEQAARNERLGNVQRAAKNMNPDKIVENQQGGISHDEDAMLQE